MILVFGKTGQVAREIARADPAALCAGRERVDLIDPRACHDLILQMQPAAVINAAAHTAVDRAEGEADLAHTINAEAPAAMARACAALGVPLVQISTDYVFDGAGSAPFAPDHPPAPLGVYGRTKLKGEDGVRAAGGVHAILRTSWVFSAHGSNFVRTMLRLGAERDSLRVVADQIGGPTPASAIARACLTIAQALRDDPRASGTYHFSGAPDVSWADFARAIMAQAGLDCRIIDIPTTDYPTPARRPLNSRLDCAGLARLGLQRPEWQPALAQVIRELKEAT
ncbi:dTDP-4-dehydrorhamnose reductase [Rhodobacteraceae bacterium 2376]|uniref:dTDP-4-dehydrorhamnose reductase n=1 Tax=Rhabdonatronobacter sediminivivens TaxID=2743469 RepID=A0A7Z0HYT9_9RHOB|nr:dTDP-4-dehydrorhamnose reductase [Rhabdonatronobacter sediminivivens]NYS24811.1 dTDP-4-dehydrorhamnose reductase [Rhabdonatronobacter sediminivivens]